MTRVWVGVLAFAGGVVAGLLLAQAYANAKIGNDITGGLTKLGVSPGTAASISGALVPVITA